MVTQEELLKKGKEMANSALQKFIKNIGLNTEDFDHLYNIPMNLTSNIVPMDFSSYNPRLNIIKINQTKLKEYITMINEKKKLEIVVVVNIAKNIVHEMLRANRTVTMFNNETKRIETDLISAFYDRKEGETDEDAEVRIEHQTSFEEIITKSLSEIIIQSRDENHPDFEEINNKIQKNIDNKEIYLGLKILEVLNEDKIETYKWFMTDTYQEKHYDLYEETFKEDYNDLLYYADEIYQISYCDQVIPPVYIIEALAIIDKVKNERKKEKRR